ncbi:MAG: EAL domain-containing protein, partial [Alphaproteobacteria bacterium]
AWSELEFEITESVLVKDFDFATGQLQQLRDAGATVAIDDFGTGYSSLAYLTRLPTDTIKIDRAFSRRLHEPETQAVVLSIIALGRALNKTVVAEGVETLEDVELLSTWGCYIIQGYVYSKPLTAAIMTEVLRGKALRPTTSDASLGNSHNSDVHLSSEH